MNAHGSIKDDRKKYEQDIFQSMQEQLMPYGVKLLLARFTSIYPSDDSKGDAFRELDKKRSELSLEEGKANVDLLREKNRVKLAVARLASVEAEAKEALRKAEIEKEYAQAKLDAAKLVAESEVEKVRLLAEYLGPEGAALYLSVREAATQGIDILPDVVVPNGGDALPAFLTEQYLNGPSSSERPGNVTPANEQVDKSSNSARSSLRQSGLP